MERTMLGIKFTSGNLPLLYFAEILEQVKPLFKLVNIFVGRKAQVYPKAASIPSQYMIAVRWLKQEVLDAQTTGRISPSFASQVFNKLVELKTVRKHNLVKNREFQFEEAARLQENIRFT